ncbi:DedA family protein [Streptomyces angustmyceticus]|uniref:DedA family protein n=1 Tax=Streptomyces angustmyceticus TaxID=285578 RepID=UPI0036A0929C
MNSLTGLLSQIPPGPAYAVLAAAIIAESVLLVGALIPTLALMLTAGALARTGSMNLLWIVAVAASAVMIGDALAHRTGHLLGPRLRTGKVGRRIPAAAWQRAETLMNRRAGQTLLLLRFIPVLRTLAPHLAGVTGLPYRRIAPYSALASVAWASVESGAGYTAALSVQHLSAIGGS